MGPAGAKSGHGGKPMREVFAQAQAIESGRIAPVYLVHGPELYLHQVILGALRRAIVPPGMESLHQVEWVGGPPVEELIEAAATPGFGGGRRLLVCVDHPLFAKERPSEREEERFCAYLERPWDGAAILFRQREPADGRRRTVQRLAKAGVVLQAIPPKLPEVEGWIRERAAGIGLRLEGRAASILVERVGAQLASLERELEKLADYAWPEARVGEETVARLVGPSREESVFALVDAVGSGQTGQALALLARMLRQGEQPLGLLALIVRQWRLLWQASELVAQGYNASAIAKQLGLHPYVAQKVVAQSRRPPAGGYARGLEAALEAELAIKTGRLAAPLALELLLIRLAGAA